MKFKKCLITVFAFAAFILSIQQSFASSKTHIQGPTLGSISSSYGYRKDPFDGRTKLHTGIDIACSKGTPIYAMQDGIVTFSGRLGNYGKAIIIDHFFSDIPELPRLQTKYAHNSKNYVKEGQYVRRGQVIGLVGSTGRSTGAHLHFEVLYKNHPVDPIEYLTKLPKYLQYAKIVRERRQQHSEKYKRRNS